MTRSEKEVFLDLCRADLRMNVFDGDGIGTYNEKRLHRILKRFITEDASCYEIKLGRYVADVVFGGVIYEIQTASFRTLSSKIRYYLENTDLSVCIIRPVIIQKSLIRAERDTGEVIRVTRSTKKGRPSDVLPELYHLTQSVFNERLSIRLVLVNAEEYRFSEAQRYRRKGRYDCDLRPTALEGCVELSCLDDWRALIREELLERDFSASEFEKHMRISGRNRYYALEALCSVGIIEKKVQGRRTYYTVLK